jgi:hypothetical protein
VKISYESFEDTSKASLIFKRKLKLLLLLGHGEPRKRGGVWYKIKKKKHATLCLVTIVLLLFFYE